MSEAPYIYEITNLDLSSWHTLERLPNPWENMGDFVTAAVTLRERVPELANWHGAGDYWYAPLPIARKCLVIVRPDHNPFASGWLISPIPMPGLAEFAKTMKVA